jgi:AcrR family transcriptional regulator
MTRRRILEATMALHDEQGIVATSIRDVAARADVAPATVLRHFPAMGDLVEACGRLSDELYPMPDAAVLEGSSGASDGIRRIAAAFFTWWAAYGPGWNHLQADRTTLDPVDGWLGNVEARRRELVASALGARASPTRIALLAAVTSHGAWESLRDAGLTPEEAARQVARAAEKGVLH